MRCASRGMATRTSQNTGRSPSPTWAKRLFLAAKSRSDRRLDPPGERQLVPKLPELDESAGDEVDVLDVHPLGVDVGAQDGRQPGQGGLGGAAPGSGTKKVQGLGRRLVGLGPGEDVADLLPGVAEALDAVP